MADITALISYLQMKNSLILTLFFVEAMLFYFLARDFKGNRVSSQVGTFDRDQKPVQFWFWTLLFAVLWALVVAATAALLFVPEVSL